MAETTVIKLFFLVILLSAAKCQQDITQAAVPTFRVGVFYPTRSNQNADQTEITVCRAIVDHIDRNTPRFRSELVSNTNSRISFQTADSRFMSSRMQSRLDALEVLHRSTNRRITVLKAWTPFPDPELAGRDASLHYEGRSVSVRLPSGSNYNNFLRSAVEAGFDWVYYESSNRVRLSVLPSNCARNIDLVFMLDRSGSVGRTNHQLALQFMSTAVSFFTIGSSNTRVGVVAYSSSANDQFNLNRHNSLGSLQNAISNIAFTGGATNTPAALDNAREMLDPDNNRGARPNSEGIPKLAILITDGRSNRGNLNAAVSAISSTTIQVYTVGIGNINRNELRNIASDPDDEHVFILTNYLDAAGFVDFLSVTTCDAPAVFPPGEKTTTETTDGGINYFKSSCPAFSNRVLVESIDVRGTSYIFASGTTTNPSPLTSITIANETAGTTRRTCEVPLQGNSKVVYIGVQGQTRMDRCCIFVWDLLFVPEEACIRVVEGRPVGTQIYDVQQNLTSSATNQRYEYSIIEGNEDQTFSINSNGIVSLRKEFDFDQQSTHQITVQAQNRDHDCQRARIRIIVKVISNAITFNSIPPQTIPETSQIGRVVTLVTATGGLGSIVYSIIGGNDDQTFRIGTNTGRLRLNRIVDHETVPQYSIRVQARSTEIEVTGTITIVINVGDVNEQPSFTTACARQSAGCSYTITENSSPTILGSIIASDPDLPTTPNGMLQYRLDPSSTLFSVDDSGRLSFTRQLDRETQSSYAFTLIVRDSCVGCSLSVSTTVRITVEDENDNAPVFSLTHDTLQVSEDLPQNTAVAEYRATDADVGTNANIEYSLSPDNIPFTLSMTGTLSLTGPIDFETRQSYSVTITASNPGTALTATTTTTIQILNVNDNTPVITGEPYRVSIAENSPINTLLTTLTASDGDLGIHGDIRYTITSGNLDQTFSLDSVSGRLTIRNNIDREMISSFSLAVRARDRGTPRTRQDTTTISVTVTDVNDNAPIFRPDTYSVQLREDIPVGRDVIRVLATDADQFNTPNSIITYSITSGNTGNAFRVTSSSGQIQTNQNLDFETTSFYTLVVEGRDRGSPVMSSTATVTVTVINVNENPPTLTGDQSVNISESAPVGSTVAVFQAQDQDQMAITLSIQSGNEEGKFAIGSSSGVITIANMLDYETTTSYALTIRASDGQQNTDSMLAVNVLDINEFSPQFSGPSDFSILEEISAGSRVGTVQATDRDRDAEVTYEFVGRNQANEKFSLNSRTGEITTTSVLDREALTLVFIPPLSRVMLQVAATDNGSPTRQSFRDYTITLVDINDNTPTFSDATYSNQLRENLPAGQLVFSSSASDTDLGTNAQISYSFVLTNNQGSSNPFQIDQGTGVITTTMPLDCELQPFYLFSITATDAGSPPRSSTVTGNLTLIDENDNAPQFSQDIFVMSVREDRATGVLDTFTATDIDKGLNGEVQYRIVQSNVVIFREGQNSGVVFQINPNSGVLRTLTRFNFEFARQVNVTIIASDRGIPIQSSSATLVVNVMNVDEIAPRFIQTELCDTAAINEDVPIGTAILTCQATDTDSIAMGNEIPITFSITDATSSFFEINPTNGTVTTSSRLDREALSSSLAVIIVRATDSSGRFSERRAIITVSDVNDNPPQFENTPYQYTFTNEDISQFKQHFFTVQATDPDLNENAAVSYSIGNIHRQSEAVTLVEVVAQDAGNPAMRAAVNITVTFESPCLLQTYTVTPSSGNVSAQLLCAIAMSPAPSFSLTFGQTGTLSCNINTNSPVEYQWLHNGTALTNRELVESNSRTLQLTLTDITYSHSGEYACLAFSLAGSLQSPASVASIQVLPTVTTAPSDTTVQLGSTATFTCVASGTPAPSISWVVGTRVVGQGNTLAVNNVAESDAAAYTCVATNDAGSVASPSARLVIFDEFHVVQVELTNINNPSQDGSCQFFDPSAVVGSIQSATTQRVVVTGLSGTNLCELTPCSPSPCKNSGICSERDGVKGNYECAFCRLGYTGVNCTADVDECAEGACGGNGVCSNTEGSFMCACNQNFTGRRCQYEERCSSNPCQGANEVCVDTLATTQGYQCQQVDTQTSLTVMPPAGITKGQLDDLIQRFLDRNLQINSASQSTRRKRQVSNDLTTSCEPRFVSGANSSIVLLWVCPGNDSQPSAEEQAALCQYLFEQNAALECTPPNGETLIMPTSPTLSATNVRIDLVFLDQNNEPVDALESVTVLEDPQVQEELSRSGVTVGSVAAQESGPRPSESSTNTGAIVGGVVGSIIAVALIVMVAVLVVVVLKKRHSESVDIKQKKKEKAQQMISMELGNGSEKQTSASHNTGNIQHSEDNDYDVLEKRL